MDTPTERPFVGRDDEIEALANLLPSEGDGPRTVVLAGAEGSGRRALVSQLIPRAPGRLILRWRFVSADDGVSTLLRLHASLTVGLARQDEQGKELRQALRDAATASDSERLSAWVNAFLDQVETSERDEQGNLQLRLPKDNPYWGLLHVLLLAAQIRPLVLELSEVNAVTSPSFWLWFCALRGEVQRRGLPVLWLLSSAESPWGEDSDDILPTPSGLLHETIAGQEYQTISLAPWDDGQVQAVLDASYRPHALPEQLAPKLHALSRGNPGRLVRWLDLLEAEERVVWDEGDGFGLTCDVDDLTLEKLVPDPPALGDDIAGLPPAPEDRRKLVMELLHTAAVEGEQFTAGALAELLGLDRDTVDDLLDEAGDLVEEVRHLEHAQTWLYRFRNPLWREHYLRAGANKKSRSLPGRMARVLLDGFVPASPTYLPVAARLFCEANQQRQARNLLSMAMGSDRLDLSRMAIEMAQTEGTDVLPTRLLRFIHAESAERASNGAPIEAATMMMDYARSWAAESGDEQLASYERFLRSKLALRQRNLDESVALAEEALTGFEARNESVRAAETLNHLALLSLHKQDAAAARNYVERASKASNIPPVKAHAQFIRGLLRKGQRKPAAAAESFDQAAQTALQAGNVLLALEARMNHGEMLIVQGRADAARTPLRKARDTARALRAVSLERSASSLLAQAEAAAGSGKEAYDLARDTLELTRQMGLQQALAADLYHCGLFAVAAGEPEAARKYLRDALEEVHEADLPLQKELHFHLGQLQMTADSLDLAQSSLEHSLELSRKLGDTARAARVQQALGMVQEKRGHTADAVALYREAADAMTAPALQRERDAILRHIKDLDT